MLIHDFIQVERPFAEVSAAVLRDPAAVFVECADVAYCEGERLWVRLTPSRKHPVFGKRVELDFGRVYQRDDRLVVPIQWWASGAAVLFPRLDADLEVAPLGARATQITLMGRYDPPLASLGRGTDRLLLHRIAEACVRSFLTRAAASLEGAPSLEVAAG